MKQQVETAGWNHRLKQQPVEKEKKGRRKEGGDFCWVQVHVLSPFPMSLAYLESKPGVTGIFWSNFQLLKQVLLSNFGSWGVIQAD